MAEEKKEQATEVKKEVKADEPSEKKAKEELKFDGDPFTENRMEKWMEETGINPEDVSFHPNLSPPGEVEEKEEKEEPEEKEEKEEKEQALEKEPSEKDKETSDKETKQKAKGDEPYAVIQVDGKDREVATKEEYDKLAMQGLSSTEKWQQASEMNKESQMIRNDFNAMNDRIKFLEGQLSATSPRQEEETDEEKYAGLDPEYREELKKRDERIANLEQKYESDEQTRMQAEYERARADMDRNIDEAFKAHPFEEIKLGERNVSEELYAGLVTTKFNEDRMRASRDPNFRVRLLADITKEAAQDLQAIEAHFKESLGGSSDLPKGEVTKELLAEKYPEIVKSLQKDGITAYLDEQDKAPPSPKSTHGKVESRKKAVEPKGLDEAFDMAKKDPEAMEGVKQFVENVKRQT